MTAQTEILPSEPYAYDPASFDPAAYHGFAPPPGATRYDGWTPDKQRRFLEALSEGFTVVQACAIVALSKQSAYALRGSPRGASFAIGWEAAVLKARATLADELMERAFKGNRDTVTTDDGRVTTRHRHDNRLGMAMLARLDRMADTAKGAGIAAAARLVAEDFGQYLDLIGRDAGPARAGMFLGARVEPAGDAALAPIRTLARADRWLRTHTDIAEPLQIADLDPAERAGWTAEQWVRAEAAGLVDLAPETPDSSQVGQPLDSDEDELPVWWCSTRECWLTNFPPPEGYQGFEVGQYGDANYSRTVTDAEQAVLDAQEGADTATRQVAGARARDRYFGFAADADADADAAEAEAAPEAPDPADELPAPSDAPRRRAPATAYLQADRSLAPPFAPSGADMGISPGSIADAVLGHPGNGGGAPASLEE
ncbi:hypothetical protein RZN05_00305 [Sphingomonas sp. HF-S4]|uniref:Terminase n=1 Tax=Sphingomonas agrestis TaxID=3080540 RepID=A0ABU3Y212_9SPHN|nr:hypothetical protein [Sphingomonas sp. HF-S4]MDV3455406.1 hypothetical protein [Sphingomonas sp. HF-S4]